MRWIVAAALALVACKQGTTEKPPPTDKVTPPAAGARPESARPAHIAPKGTIAGKAFAPNVVMLLDTSDGGKLGLYTASEQELRDRQRCEEPMGSGSTFEITKYAAITDWQVGKPLTSELGDWSATGVEWSAKPKGGAKVTLSKKDPKAFTVAGTIEISGEGWNLSGAFSGEYCPTKSVKRDDHPAPLAARAWTMAPIAANDVPRTPLEAIVAGSPTKIAHVTVREVPYHDGSKRQRFVFYTAKPPEPCSARPEGGHTRTYSSGKLVGEDAAAFQTDNFSLDLTAAPVAGAALAGNSHFDHGEKRDQIADADLQVFEPDGYRSWRYAQYFSAALAIDEVTETEVRARVQLSLPDEGKSMLVGAFTAKRCPPETD